MTETRMENSRKGCVGCVRWWLRKGRLLKGSWATHSPQRRFKLTILALRAKFLVALTMTGPWSLFHAATVVSWIHRLVMSACGLNTKPVNVFLASPKTDGYLAMIEKSVSRSLNLPDRENCANRELCHVISDHDAIATYVIHREIEAVLAIDCIPLWDVQELQSTQVWYIPW